MKKSVLLERLSKEKPAHEQDEIGEALRRGYSVEQIIQAQAQQAHKPVIKNGYIEYTGEHGYLKIPYTYEAFKMLCRLLFY